ncbi:TECT2-like protein [Mya arenaria]|uniref:TECT2-like protein n=1 Tax=Mya arenaria TaxID=6604 RepID=A0ABY7E098_MYAAR|nr:TECT2-like protein [Mya arenaria]
MINMHTFAALFLLAVSSASAQIAQETEVINAAFEDIAPCPCDLTGGSCDTNCCCDSDCTDDQKRTFEACIPFLPGGQDPETQHHRCTSTHQNKEDWFPLLCVQFEYNAFLGYFYDWQKKLANNTQTFLDRLSTVSYYWYREQDSRQVADLGVVAYKYGTRVKTKSETPSRFGTFTLPQPVLSDAATDNFNNITGEPYTRSGKVGYDKGSEFFSGSIVYNTTTDPRQFLFVNSNASRQMAVFSPGPDGLCEGSGRRVLKFGEDITTSCTLQLNVANFTDCTALREDLTQGCTLSEYFPLGSSPVDRRAGICFNMTNTIQLDIFYAETGQSNSYPIYEVLGSKVSYQNTSWSVRCSNMAGGVCEGTESQPFLLTSRVRFTQIPPQIPKPVSKYYESPREDNKQLCPGDRCWDNLMHPFTRRYNSESREYVFGMVSLSIIFFIGYGLVSRPFW